MPLELIILKSEFKNKSVVFREINDTLGFIAFYNDEVLKIYRNTCPHMGAKLEAQHFCSQSGSITCPWHAYKFELNSGALIENPGIENWIRPLVEEGSHFLKLRNLKLIPYPFEEKDDSFRILIHEV